MSKDKPLLNGEKTKFLIIATRQQLAKVNIDSVSIGTTNIAASDSPIKNLEWWLDKN